MSKNLGRLLVILFVVADVFLVAGMMRHVNKTPTETDVPEAAASAVTAAPTTSATPAAESTQDAYEFVPSTAVMMSAANDGSVAYAVRGRCSGGAPTVVSYSAAGDGNFAAVTPSGVVQTLALKITSKTDLTIVGTGDDCKPRQLRTVDGGKSWKKSGETTLWYASAGSPAAVVSPDRTSKPGCTVTSLSQLTTDSARVTCSDGTVKGTGDGGKSWVDLGRLDNIRVAAFTAPGRAYALARFQGCAAQAFTTRDGGRTWEQGGCITGDPAQGIAATATRLDAMVGSQLYRSDDFGKAWSQPDAS